MTKAAVETTKALMLVGEGRYLNDLYQPEIPRFDYMPGRWATLRSKNVEQMASVWSTDPERVFVLNDRKLAERELVVLCKEMFDQILTPLRELSAGRAALKVDINIIASNVSALKHVLELLKSTIEGNEETSAHKAVEAALNNIDAIQVQITKLDASIVLPNPIETPDAELDGDERALAKEILKEEEDD